jgi:hypothetical protein
VAIDYNAPGAPAAVSGAIEWARKQGLQIEEPAFSAT